MVLTFSPIVNIFRLSQPQNAPPPIVVTEFGISTLVKLLHLANADSPIVVTEFGISTLVKLMQLLNLLLVDYQCYTL